MPLGTEVGFGLGHIVLDGNLLSLQKGAQQLPTSRPISIVAKWSPISATAELLPCYILFCILEKNILFCLEIYDPEFLESVVRKLHYSK